MHTAMALITHEDACSMRRALREASAQPAAWPRVKGEGWLAASQSRPATMKGVTAFFSRVDEGGAPRKGAAAEDLAWVTRPQWSRTHARDAQVEVEGLVARAQSVTSMPSTVVEVEFAATHARRRPRAE